MANVLPDSEAVTVAFLRGHALLTSYSGAHVATVIQPDWSGFALRVVRVGGTLLSAQVDSPRLQLDCWSSTDDLGGAAVANFALHVAACIPDLNGPHGAAWVTNVDVADGPIPEAADNGRPRVRLDITFDIANT